MKKDSSLPFKQVSTKMITQLATEQQETIATEFAKNFKVFSAVDLWHIHRQHKPVQHRRMCKHGI